MADGGGLASWEMLGRSLENLNDDSTSACQLGNIAGPTRVDHPLGVSYSTAVQCIGQCGAVELDGPDRRGDPS